MNYLLLISLVINSIGFVVAQNKAESKDTPKRYLVLSSGDEKETHEAWYVTQTKLDSLPLYNPTTSEPPISQLRAANIALQHAEKRYGDKFVVSQVSLERFIETEEFYPKGFSKDWVYLIQLVYNNKGNCQIVPVLLDGTIVLSDNELED